MVVTLRIYMYDKNICITNNESKLIEINDIDFINITTRKNGARDTERYLIGDKEDYDSNHMYIELYKRGQEEPTIFRNDFTDVVMVESEE